VATYRLLRRDGVDVRLVFGAGEADGAVEAHCWLERDGEPFLEDPDPRPIFRQVYVFGGASNGSSVRNPVRTSRTYRVHGVDVMVDADDDLVLRAVDARLGPFAAPAGPATLRFTATCVGREPLPSVTGRIVYDDGVAEVRYDDEADHLTVTCGDLATMVCRPGDGTADVEVGRWETETRRLVAGPILTLAVLEVCRRHQLFSLHAAAVTNAAGDVVLLAGPSGAGKSTLAIALVRAGWGFLGDDTVFLRDDAGEVVVCSFPDQADVTDATVEMFPELASLLAQAPHPRTGKRPFRLEDHYGPAPVSERRPATIVFPKIVDSDASRLWPVSQVEALFALAPNVLLTDVAVCRSHLEILGRLSESVPCHRFDVGRDLDDAVRILRDQFG
jgi:hypothetical protein